MKFLPLNVGLIVLKNHTGPKDLAYTLLLRKFFANHMISADPVSQYLALRMQLVQLSNIYNDSKNEWDMVEKNAGGNIGHLK